MAEFELPLKAALILSPVYNTYVKQRTIGRCMPSI